MRHLLNQYESSAVTKGRALTEVLSTVTIGHLEGFSPVWNICVTWVECWLKAFLHRSHAYSLFRMDSFILRRKWLWRVASQYWPSYDFFKDFIYLFLERGEGREKERERNINVREKHPSVTSRMRPTWDQTRNLGVSPNWESHWWPSSLWNSAQPTEPRQSGFHRLFLQYVFSCAI